MRTQEQRPYHTGVQAWDTKARPPDDLDAAACPLVEIAGPAPQHIEMSPTGPKRYYSVARPLIEADASVHLRGWKTKGTLCSRQDGRARALAYDANDPEHWHAVRIAARKLARAGYRPLLEPAARGRGGHLWLIYMTLVDASAARYHAHSIAPELAQIAEYWPGSLQVQGWNRVRLPGGRYGAPGGFSARQTMWSSREGTSSQWYYVQHRSCSRRQFREYRFPLPSPSDGAWTLLR